MARDAKAEAEAKAKTRGLQGERKTRIQTAGRDTLEEGTMRCIYLLKHDESAAARTAGAMASISLSTDD